MISTRARRLRAAGALCLAASAALLGGCAQRRSYEPLIAAGRFEEAAESARRDPEKNQRKRELLYYLRLGTFEQLAGLHDESIVSFETAKRVADDLYTRSIRDEAVSFMLNDYFRPYAGENFERALIRILNAINYAIQQDEEEALVEARQVDSMLTQLNMQQGGKNVYAEDAFGRYLTGMLYEEAGDVDNARVSYLKALEAYSHYSEAYGVRAPRALFSSAMGIAQRHSQRAIEEVRRYGEVEPRSLPSGAGELVILHFNGWIPEKVEEHFAISWNDGWPYVTHFRTDRNDADVRRAWGVAASIAADDTFHIALPKLVARPYAVRRMRIRCEEAISLQGPVVVEDIGAIAKKDLKDRINRIFARTVARAAVRFAAKKAVEHRLDEDEDRTARTWFNLAAAVADWAIEHADTRQWKSLPDEIQLANVVLPAGSHSVRIDYAGIRGVIKSEVLSDVRVREGRRTFMIVRTVQ